MADLASKQLLPKSVRIAAGAVVCVESEIRGQVTIGTRTVIHPKARILADAGPIIIGENNLIEEQVVIINRLPDKNPLSEKNEMEPVTMVIGTNNVFEVGCQSEALKIGDYNTIESKAMVGRSTVLSSGCVVGACCKVNTDEVIPENTVVFGERCLRRTQSEKPQSQSLQLDFLMKILPNYHHLKKPKAAAPAKV